jgi:regulator of replication initiation timing
MNTESFVRENERSREKELREAISSLPDLLKAMVEFIREYRLLQEENKKLRNDLKQLRESTGSLSQSSNSDANSYLKLLSEKTIQLLTNLQTAFYLQEDVIEYAQTRISSSPILSAGPQYHQSGAFEHPLIPTYDPLQRLNPNMHYHPVSIFGHQYPPEISIPTIPSILSFHQLPQTLRCMLET